MKPSTELREYEKKPPKWTESCAKCNSALGKFGHNYLCTGCGYLNNINVEDPWEKK